MDYEKIILNVLTLWFKDRETFKRFFVILGLTVLFTVVTAVVVISLILLLAGTTDITNVVNPQSIAQLGSAVLIIFVVLVPLFILFMLYLVFQLYKIEVRALQLVGFETAPFGFVKFLKTLFLLSLYTCFVILTSWYHDKFRIYFIVMFLLGFFSLIGAFLFPPIALLSLLALLMFFPYIFVMIYTSIRLSLGNAIYLQKDQGIIDSVRESWELSTGKVVEIFVANVIVSIIFFVIAIGLIIIQFGIEFLFTILSLASIGILISVVFNLVFQLLFSVMQQFLNPSIYAQLKNQVPSSEPKAQPSEVSLPSQNISSQSSQGFNRRRAVAQRQAEKSVEKQVQSKPVISGVLTMSETSQVEKLVDLLKDKTHDYSKEDLIHVMQDKGYNNKVVNTVLKRLRKN
ncbi:MAG: hypothetical protein ABIH20_01590 [Candidatus Diapherotrites archaeon]